jgi:hypothetical protein
MSEEPIVAWKPPLGVGISGARTLWRRLAPGGPVALALLILLAAAPLNVTRISALPPSERTGWMTGMGFLLGSGNLDSQTGFDPGWVSGVTPQFRLGRILIDDRLLLSAENKQWTRERGNLPTVQPPPGTKFIKYQMNTQVYALALTAYPGNPDNLSGGFFLNVGAGPAVARVDSAEVDTLGSGEDPPEDVVYEWGWGYYVGGGYEFRFFPSLAAGFSLNYIYSAIDQELVNNTQVWSLAFTLNWYFK